MPNLINLRLRGVSLIEASIGLLVLGLVMAASVPYAISLQQEAMDEQSARQLEVVEDAANSYVKANFAALEAQIVAAGGQPLVISMPQLAQGAYLPSGFVDTNGFGQTHEVVIRRTGAGILEATVFTTGGNPPTDIRAAGIANRIPGGAYVASSNPSVLQGPGFQLPLSAFAGASIQPRVGSLSASLLFRGDSVLNDYVYRNPVPGYPQAQQLGPGSTLDLNNQPVINAGTISPVTGNPLTIGGDLNVTGASSFQGPVTISNQLKATGGAQLANIFVGQLDPDWISAAPGHNLFLGTDAGDAIVEAVGGNAVATVTAGNLNLAGNMQISGSVDFGHDVWHTSGGFNRFFFSSSGETLFGGSTWAFQTTTATVAQIGGNGAVQILGSGNFTVPGRSGQGLANATGTAWFTPEDPAGNSHLYNAGGAVLIDGQSVALGDPAGNAWLGISGAGATFTVPVAINNDLAVNGDAMVAGTLTAARIVTSALTINGDLTINGNEILAGSLFAGSLAHFRSGLDNDTGTLTLSAADNQTIIATKLTVQGGRNVGECCGTDATLAVTGDATRPPSIDWNEAGVAEGLMQISATGWRRIEFTDQQGQGLGIYATGRIHTTGNLTADGNVQLTGSGNFIVPAQSASGLVTTAGTAFLHLDDASHNTQIANAAGGGIFLDSAAFHARDPMGLDWLAIAASGATISVPVTVNANLTSVRTIYARGGLWNDVADLNLGSASQPTNINGSQIALNAATTIQALTVTGTESILGAAAFQAPVTINASLTVNGSEFVNGQAQATNFVIPDIGYVAGEACGAANNGKSRWNPTLYSNLGGMERCVGGAATWRPFNEYQWSDWTACTNNSQSRQCIKLGQNYPVSDARYCGGASANDFTQTCQSCAANAGQSCSVYEGIYCPPYSGGCGVDEVWNLPGYQCTPYEYYSNPDYICFMYGITGCDGSCQQCTHTGSWQLGTPACQGTTQVTPYVCKGGDGQCCTPQPAAQTKQQYGLCGSCSAAEGQPCTIDEGIDGVNVLAENDLLHNFCADLREPAWPNGTIISNQGIATCMWSGTTQCDGSCSPGSCTNGALYWPACNVCPNGQNLENGICQSPVNNCAPNQGQSCGGTGTVACDGTCTCPAGTSYVGTQCVANAPGYTGSWTAGPCSKACNGGTISGSTCSNGNCDPALNPDGSACNTQPGPSSCLSGPPVTCGYDQASINNPGGCPGDACVAVGGQPDPLEDGAICSVSCTYQAQLVYGLSADGCSCTVAGASPISGSGVWWTVCTNGSNSCGPVSAPATYPYNVCAP